MKIFLVSIEKQSKFYIFSQTLLKHEISFLIITKFLITKLK